MIASLARLIMRTLIMRMSIREQVPEPVTRLAGGAEAGVDVALAAGGLPVRHQLHAGRQVLRVPRDRVLPVAAGRAATRAACACHVSGVTATGTELCH